MSMEVKYFKAKYIIIWDQNQHKTLQNGYLAVRGSHVEGFYTELPEGAPYEDLGNVAITPGFITIHGHPTELYTLRSYREDIGNPAFYESTLYDYAMAIPQSTRMVEVMVRMNMVELIKGGCTTGLIYGGGFSQFQAHTAGELGWRAYIGGDVRAGNPLSVTGIWYSPDGHSLEYSFDEESGLKRLDEAVAFIQEYDGAYDGRIHGILAPTQTMTCTPDILKKVRQKADALGVGITIHGSESMMEFESCLRMFGKTPVQFMAEHGMVGSDVVVGHCYLIQGHSNIHMYGDDDIRILSESGTTVAHCPNVLARGGNSLQSFARYRDAGVNVGLGTDTFPCDYMLEMRQAAYMGKLMAKSTFAVTAKDVFQAATINGAKALNRSDLGRLAPGAKADFVVFKLDSIEMSPVRDVVKNIVYSATRHSVDSVYIDGKCIVKHGKMNGIDEEALACELQELAEAAWIQTPEHDRFARTVNELSPLSAPLYEGEF